MTTKANMFGAPDIVRAGRTLPVGRGDFKCTFRSRGKIACDGLHAM